ncbi:altered inheritance of mitochondria protein 23, mitochondrial [[Candida] railenensis]|uniref:Altered inheritance of mitochondria protein 23, mitochondrial n=1 Tax=[Candida] railenensis TaxID=45579 RepID=A0A9P0QLJ0_9ASCO|nr:altered inheritance of mitochondria protein 23, mitochondrial [[Candida] railenensis]
MIYAFRSIPTSLIKFCPKQGNNGVLLTRTYATNRFAAQFKAPNTSTSDKPSSNRFASKYETGGSKGKEGQKLSGNRRQNNHDRKPHHGRKLPQPKKLTFEFNTGTDSSHNALRSIIDKVHHLNNGKYMVRYVNPATKKLETVHLASITNALDLKKEGVFIVPSKDDEGSFPIIRVNTLPEMLKAYSDELADLRHQELLEKGSRAAKRAQQSKDRAEKKKSSTKIVTISWEISFSDFHNQKIKEIQKKIDKGESFVIFIGDKKNLVSARKNVDRSDGLVKKMQGAAEEVDLESEEGEGEDESQQQSIDSYVAKDLDIITRAKREKMISEIKEFLTESVGKLEVSGTLDRRITYMCSKIKKSTQAQAATNGAQEEISPKEQRRLKRLQKQQQQQQQQQSAKSNVKEEDLDSLYQNLKFDD